MKTPARITEALEQAAAFFGCGPEEFEGQTLNDVFSSAERSGANVYWGFWSEQDLGHKIETKEE